MLSYGKETTNLDVDLDEEFMQSNNITPAAVRYFYWERVKNFLLTLSDIGKGLAYLFSYYGFLLLFLILTFFVLHPVVLGKLADIQERLRKKKANS